jgi:hypothetical protein
MAVVVVVVVFEGGGKFILLLLLQLQLYAMLNFVTKKCGLTDNAMWPPHPPQELKDPGSSSVIS